MNEREFVIKKNGLFYREKAAGYTSSLDEAGRYSYEEAKKHEYLRGDWCDHVTIHPLDSFPPTKLQEALNEIKTLKAENEKLKILLDELLL